MSTPQSSARRTHLKRLSLSATPREHLPTSTSQASAHSLDGQTHDRHCVNALAGPSSLSGLAATSRNRSAARPLSLYSSLSAVTAASAGSSGHLEHVQHTPFKSGVPSAPNSAPATSSHHDIWQLTQSPLHSARQPRQLHPLAAADPDCSNDSIFSAASETSEFGLASPLNRRRSLLGRSHSRKQGSISYARSPSTSGAASPAASQPFTPRSALPPARSRPLTPDVLQGLATAQSLLLDASDIDNVTFRTAAAHPDTAYSNACTPTAETCDTSLHGADVSANLAATSLSTDLLTFIAKKERKCMDLREELQRNEEELSGLKKKWESIMQRELAAALPLAAARPTSPTAEAPAGSGLLSSLTASFTAATSPAITATRQAKPGNHRLLTSRHSISVPSQLPIEDDEAADFKAFSEYSAQRNPHPEHDGNAANYDVGKMARSWLGGIARSATSMLETIAPPASGSSDLGTVREVDENDDGPLDAAASSRRPGAASSSMKEGRRTSNVTVSTSAESGSPSSCNDEGRFSSNASRSSSVSSLDSSADRLSDDMAHPRDAQRKTPSHAIDDTASARRSTKEDYTPLATPTLLQHATPKGAVAASDDDQWAFGDDFENSAAREHREALERKRIYVQDPHEPRAPRMSSPKHGRRRSTAFELGGTWGTMVGRKWNEVANSETFRYSKQATLSFVDSVEKTLTDAITVDAPVAGPGVGRQRTSSTVLSASGDVITIDNPSSRRSSSTSLAPSGTNSWNILVRSTQARRARHASIDDAGDTDSAAPSARSIKPASSRDSSTKPSAMQRSATHKHAKRTAASQGRSDKTVVSPDPLRSPLTNVAEDATAESEEAWGW